MRSKLLICLFLLAIGIKANEIVVNTGNFSSSFNNAQSGDVLLMEAGTYSANLTISDDRALILRGNEEGVVFVGRVTVSPGVEGGSLTMEKMKIECNGSDLFTVRGTKTKDEQENEIIIPVSYDIIRVIDCQISGMARSLYFGEYSTQTELTIENTIIDASQASSYSFNYGNYGYIQNVTIKNSTVYNYSSEHFMWFRSYEDTPIFNINYENNTFYKVGGSNNRYILNIDGNSNPQSQFTFTNNLFVKPYYEVDDKPAKIFSVKNNNGSLTANNNLIVEYGTPYYSITEGINDITLEELGLTEVPFEDPNNGNFTIPSTSTLIVAGVNGVPLGDPRWVITNEENLVELKVSINIPEAGSVNPEEVKVEAGTRISIKASANSGYSFAEWQDIAGNTISEDNPYVFTIEEDTELIAIFQEGAITSVNPTNFNSAFNNAQSGDVLLMEAGTYSANLTISDDRALILRGNEEGVVFVGRVTVSPGVEGGSLTMEKMKIECNGSDLFTVRGTKTKDEQENEIIIPVSYDIIRVTDCQISGMARSLYFGEYSTQTELTIENTIIDASQASSYSFNYGNYGYIQNVTIKNSTVYNYSSEHFMWFRSYEDTPIFNINYENNTFYKVGGSNNRYILNIDGNSNPQSQFTFTNNLFVKPYYEVDDKPAKIFSVKNNNGSLTANNNLIVEYGTPYYSITEGINDITLEELGLTEIPFEDPNNGNFTIPENSPIATAGVDGAPLGDPRWIVMDEISYTRAMYVDGGFETICLPFSVTEIIDNEGNAITPTRLLEYTGNNGETVYFSETSIMKANTPYLIALPEDNTVNKKEITFIGPTIEVADPRVTYGNYSFIGTYSIYKETTDPSYYVLNNTGDSFVKAIAETDVPAYRAYFKAIDSTKHSALKIDTEGTTNIELTENKVDSTIIYSIENIIKIISDKASQVDIYSIDGCLIRKVEILQGENSIEGLMKGIYIVNKQKVVVK